MSLDRLLRAAIKAGGTEVRLVSGRRVVIVTPGGEREVQGPPQTPEMIDELVAPVLTAESRAALAGGVAEWTFAVSGLGRVRARVERPDGMPRASFVMLGEEGALEAPPLAAREGGDGSRSAGAGRGTGEIDELFTVMARMKASDLHLTSGSPPMIRHDGEIKSLPGRAVLAPADVERILLPLAPERNRQEFSRRHDTDFAYELPGVGRFRCNFFMDRRGMGGVFRLIPSRIMTAEEMALSREILQLCSLPKGLVLVTGPTGSGKSTTLCALIDYVNRNRKDHIITVEDPIEFVHEPKGCLINQRQVGEHTDSFKDALRAALREDPDIVLVGEMRDLETVSIAIETAETGHLVFGTLHTSSAASTVDRIIDQFPADRQAQIRVMLSESLKGVISQVLCKKIGGGRVPALEILISTPSVANLIRESKIFQIPSIMQTGKRQGMCLLNDSLVDLVRRKVIEGQEAYAKAMDKTSLLGQLRKNGIETPWAPAEGAPVPGTAPA
jgi:twitching motility protein PilT